MKYQQLIFGLVAGLVLGATATAVVAQDDQNQQPEVVIREGLAPTRTAPNGDAQVALLAEGENAFFGKLRVAPNAKVPEHEDSSEEYLFVTKGQGTITINGTDYDVKPKTAIYMPPNATVSYQNGDRALEAVQFFAGPEPADKYSKWKVGESKIEDQTGSRRMKMGGSSAEN